MALARSVKVFAPFMASIAGVVTGSVAGFASADAPSAAQIAAAIAADRASLGSFAANASIEWSTGVGTQVFIAWHGDCARWREVLRSPDGVLDVREVMVDGDMGVGVGVLDAAAPDPNPTAGAIVGHRSDIESWGGVMPGDGYLCFLEHYPVGTQSQRSWSLDAQIAASAALGTASVRPDQEVVGGQSCWVVDLMHPEGHLDRTIWIAPDRNWSPVRSVLWDAAGGIVSEYMVDEWLAIAPDRWVPRFGTISAHDVGHQATMSLEPTDDLPGGVSLLVAESLLPADPQAIIPAGFPVSRLGEARAAAPADARIGADRVELAVSGSPTSWRVAGWVLAFAAGGVGILCLAAGRGRRGTA
jgi:hypothetical protein